MYCFILRLFFNIFSYTLDTIFSKNKPLCFLLSSSLFPFLLTDFIMTFCYRLRIIFFCSVLLYSISRLFIVLSPSSINHSAFHPTLNSASYALHPTSSSSLSLQIDSFKKLFLQYSDHIENILTYCRTDVFQYSFFPYLIIEWNRLDCT